MDKIQFIQAITRIRVLETRLLDRIKLDRMIDSPNAEGALKILMDSNYTGPAKANYKPEDFELLLTEELEKLYNLMYEISPEKSLIDIMCLRYDYHNLKVFLKAKGLDKDLDYLMIFVGTIPETLLKACIIKDDFRELPEIMQEGIKAAEEAYEETKDPQYIDMVLDRYLYKDMIQRANALGDPYIIEYLKMSVDFINIKTFIRIKKQEKDRNFLEEVYLEGGSIELKDFYLLLNESIDNLGLKLSHTNYSHIIKEGLEEYGKTNRINVLEKLMENYLMEYIKQGKYVTFGVEPLISYLYAKETEIKNVRIIMVGKINGITPLAIRERLRDIYV